MAEEGLPCGEDRIAFGNYLESEARLITETVIAERKPMPRAVFCANDGMAAAVCDALKKHGIRVPEDVIVTGFDGTATAWLSRPRLTTRDSDYPGQARLIMDQIRCFRESGEAEAVCIHPFRPVLSESCSCPAAANEQIRTIHNLQQSEMMYNIENTLFYRVDQMLVEKDLYHFLESLGQLILPDSALYLNKSILNINPDTEYQVDHPEDELIMVPHCRPGEQPALCQVYLKDTPLPSGEDGVTILNIVHAGERVCGYYAAHSGNLSADFRLIKRISDILNLLASVQLGRVWQRQLEARLENNLYTDFIAELPNLKGLSRWYDEYAADREHHRRKEKRPVVFGLPPAVDGKHARNVKWNKKKKSVRNVKYSEVGKMKLSRLIRLTAVICAWALLAGVFMLPAVPAFAGYNEVVVATDGNGVTVYTGSSGSKKAGILYNGYKSEIPLEPTNGRYDCFLTKDFTVWLNLDKATNREPSGHHGSDEWEAKMPCNIFLAEIVNDNTPVYTSPANKKSTALHAAGTLCVVCGEFGGDYYLRGPLDGFVRKESIRKISDMTYAQAHSQTYIWDNPETCTIYASVANPVYTAASATGYSDDFHYGGYTKNVQAVVLKDLGGWVQLTQGRFVEKRFLDPEGDHSYPVAYVKTDGILGRLNVRSSASTDAMSEVKLCSGVQVHIVSRTEKWAVIFVSAPNGGVSYTGCVMAEFLDFSGGNSVRDGSTQVRLTKDLPGDREMVHFYENAKGNVLPAGTLLKVIGVYDHQGNSRSNQADVFLCETEDGRYIRVESTGVLEPVQESGLQAAARSAVKMREAPNPDAKVLYQVKAKNKVDVLLRGEIWTLVKYKGKTGYMMSRYLSFP